MSLLRKDRGKAVDRLKKRKDDVFRIEIRLPKNRAIPPWVAAYKYVYEADQKGELVGQVLVDATDDADAVQRKLGAVLLDNSPVLQSWLEQARDSA